MDDPYKNKKRPLQLHLLTCVYMSVMGGLIVGLTIWRGSHAVEFYFTNSFVHISSGLVLALRILFGLGILVSTSVLFEAFLRRRDRSRR